MSNPTLRFLSSILLAAGVMHAQSRPVHGLLMSGSQLRITRHAACGSPATRCTTGLRAPADVWSGGLAYAPSRDTWWTSGGLDLRETAPNCNLVCNASATRVLGASSRVGGLSLSAGRGELYQLESISGRAAIVTYRLTPGRPSYASRCTFALPSAGHRAGALAYDGARDLFYVATSLISRSAVRSSILVRPRGSRACARLCEVPLPACGRTSLGAIRGMAHDECRSTLFVTDGTWVAEYQITQRTACVHLRGLRCCRVPARSGAYLGIDVEVGAVRAVGKSCTPRGCATCTTMRLIARGRPVIGNQQFQLQVDDAPAGAQAFLAIGSGPCQPRPLGCGQLFPSLQPAPLVLSIGRLAGRAPCGGSAMLQLAIPDDQSLCRQVLCAQALIACPGASTPALTNGLTLQIER